MLPIFVTHVEGHARGHPIDQVASLGIERHFIGIAAVLAFLLVGDVALLQLLPSVRKPVHIAQLIDFGL